MKSYTPSPTELVLLKILWREAPLSAREIHEAVRGDLGWSYSSTRKTLERLVEKRLVSAVQKHGIFVFRPLAKKTRTLANLISDFGKRVLEVDAPLPVSMFVDSQLLDDDELKELEQLLQRIHK